MIRHNQPRQPPSCVFCHHPEFHLLLEYLSTHWDGIQQNRSDQSNSHRNVPPILHLDRKHKAIIFRAPTSSCADEPWGRAAQTQVAFGCVRLAALTGGWAPSSPPSDVSRRLTAIRPLSFPDKIKVLGFVDKVSSLHKAAASFAAEKFSSGRSPLLTAATLAEDQILCRTLSSSL